VKKDWRAWFVVPFQRRAKNKAVRGQPSGAALFQLADFCRKFEKLAMWIN
jgi:hypothetical protein